MRCCISTLTCCLSALLCASSLVEQLGVHILPHLPHFAGSVLAILDKSISSAVKTESIQDEKADGKRGKQQAGKRKAAAAASAAEAQKAAEQQEADVKQSVAQVLVQTTAVNVFQVLVRVSREKSV